MKTLEVTCNNKLNIYTFTGQPVAWCLSDRESSDVIEAFLNSIKARSPLTTVNVMMTDDGTVNVSYIYIYAV